MHIDIFTLFPSFFASPLAVSLPARALREGLLTVRCIDFRDYATDRHRTVDDTPYGGGPGMLLRPEPIVAAFEDHPVPPGGRRIYLTPWGRPLRQPLVEELADLPALQLLCGRYEGVDERVIEGWIDDCISIGDYVLAGGEAAALVLIEAVVRLLPGVVGEPQSVADDSFSTGLLEGPQYTRPPEFRGRVVPDVLRSGDHARIAAWRREQALRRTRTWRPELLESDRNDD